MIFKNKPVFFIKLHNFTNRIIHCSHASFHCLHIGSHLSQPSYTTLCYLTKSDTTVTKVGQKCNRFLNSAAVSYF